MYYLVDGRLVRSLKTNRKGYAEALLERYIRGKLGLGRAMTIGEYYDRWIETKREPLVRRSLTASYRQHFNCYILPQFRKARFDDVRGQRLAAFVDLVLRRGLKIKTARNIIAGSFRALWRDAEREEIVDHNPFASLRWPSSRREKPDPYTAEERDALLEYIAREQSFYYPFVRFAFETGCRPSEMVGLRWSDINVEECAISITRSRHMGADARPKTIASERIIIVGRELIDLLLVMRLPWHNQTDHVFYNKYRGSVLDANQWARVYWRTICDGAEVRRRKFYATRHTSITQAVKRGENLLAIAQYHGTSVAMVEANYCGPLLLGATNIRQSPSMLGKTLVVPTGIEPAHDTSHNLKQLISARIESIRRLAKCG